MTRDPFSHVASRTSVEPSKNTRNWRTARGPCATSAIATLAAAVAIAAAQFAMGCAEEVEREPEQTAQAVESESAKKARRQKFLIGEPQLEGPESRLQKKRDWWNHAREVLFVDIDLNPEQARAVDAIIEGQLETRERMQPLDAEISAARKVQDKERLKAAREEFRALNAQLKRTHEIYEEMRALLEEEQRPAFDMNRARHVAEKQGQN